MNEVELSFVQIGTYFNRVKEYCDNHDCNCCKHKGYCSKLVAICVKISEEDYKFLRML